MNEIISAGEYKVDARKAPPVEIRDVQLRALYKDIKDSRGHFFEEPSDGTIENMSKLLLGFTHHWSRRFNFPIDLSINYSKSVNRFYFVLSRCECVYEVALSLSVIENSRSYHNLMNEHKDLMTMLLVDVLNNQEYN